MRTLTTGIVFSAVVSALVVSILLFFNLWSFEYHLNRSTFYWVYAIPALLSIGIMILCLIAIIFWKKISFHTVSWDDFIMGLVITFGAIAWAAFATYIGLSSLADQYSRYTCEEFDTFTMCGDNLPASWEISYSVATWALVVLSGSYFWGKILTGKSGLHINNLPKA